MEIKFKNGSYIKTIDSQEVCRSSKYNKFRNYYNRFPDLFLEDFMGMKLNPIQKLSLRYKIRAFNLFDRFKYKLRRINSWQNLKNWKM